ncbi:MAG: hypothetical protein LKJ90_02820 [Faecalibacterium sp.]|nr:hypothetical protein [Faecalibacterium sp.]
MKENAPENVRILRFFGSDDADRTQTLRQLTEDGKVTFREMRKGSEVLVALQCEQGKNSTKLLDHCQEKLQQVCSPAMYATNEVTLAQAAVDVLQLRDKLFVAADAETSALLESRLEKLPAARGIFDFGQQSYSHPRFAEKIEQAGAAMEKPVLAAQSRVREAFRLSGADFAISCVSAEVGSVILLGGKKGFWQRTVPQGENSALWMLDMLRRAALDKPQASGTSWQSYNVAQRGPAMPQSKGPKPVFDYLPPSGGETTLPDDAPGTETPQAAAARQAYAAAAAVPEQPDTGFPPPQPVQTPTQSTPAKKKNGAVTLLVSLLLVLVLSAAAVGAAWFVSGGELASFWNGKYFSSSNINGAQLI